MHPFHWIYNNRELLQAISGLAIVGLTFVLIVLNTVYVRANWKTMRLMEADVRFRLKPIPHVGVAPSSAWDHPGDQVWTLTVRCDHAPMVLMATSIRFSIGGGKEFEHFHVFNGETIHPQTGRQYDLTIKMPAPAQTWSLDLYYRDLSQLLDYGTVFGPTGFVADLTTVDRKTPWNRVRFWFGVQAIKRRLGMK
jgi:hypothetical protein